MKTKTHPIARFDYSNVEIPPGTSQTARRAILAIRQVPAPYWVSYSMIAQVLGIPGGQRGISQSLGTVTVAQGESPMPDKWLFCWLQVRLADGSPKARSFDAGDEIRHSIESGLYLAMGGREIRPTVAHPLLCLPMDEFQRLVNEAGI